jgi:hypothetical protein
MEKPESGSGYKNHPADCTCWICVIPLAMAEAGMCRECATMLYKSIKERTGERLMGKPTHRRHQVQHWECADAGDRWVAQTVQRMHDGEYATIPPEWIN